MQEQAVWLLEPDGFLHLSFSWHTMYQAVDLGGTRLNLSACQDS